MTARIVYRIFFLFLLLAAALPSGAQEDTAGAAMAPSSTPQWEVQPAMFRLSPCDTLRPQRLYFHLDVSSFLRNAEYAMPFTDGYTSVNYRLTPTLTYTINDRATLSGGFQFDGIVGSDSLIRFFPIFSFEYQATSWLRLVLGSLYGGLTHGLDWPLYDYERHFFSYYYHPEAGVQLLTRTRRWQSDTWIDWEHYLNPWTYDQERFVAGTHHEFLFAGRGEEETGGQGAERIPKRLAFSIPLTLMVAHRGGQFSLIDTNSGSLFNAHVGLSAQLSRPSGSSLRAYLPLYYYKNISGSDTRYTAEEPYHTTFLRGWGLYPQVTWRQPLDGVGAPRDTAAQRASTLQLVLGYWHGSRYLSPRGGLIYQSATWKTGDTTRYTHRNMLTLSATLEHHYKQVALGVDVQLFYDLTLHRADYAYGIYLRWYLWKKLKVTS